VPKACRFYDGEYDTCVENFRRQLVTVTALSAAVACAGMGLFANLPFALAPGMGLNAYFTYDVVGFRGTGAIPWKTAMAAVFIEGIIFFLITVVGLRVRIAKMFPECVKIATTGGIGFFLAHLGLQTAEGIGLVVTDVATGVTIGGCPPKDRVYAIYDRFAYDMGNYPPYTATGGVNDGVLGCNATLGTCMHLPGVTADAYTCDNSPDSKVPESRCQACISCVCMSKGHRLTNRLFWRPVCPPDDVVHHLAGPDGAHVHQRPAAARR